MTRKRLDHTWHISRDRLGETFHFRTRSIPKMSKYAAKDRHGHLAERKFSPKAPMARLCRVIFISKIA